MMHFFTTYLQRIDRNPTWISIFLATRVPLVDGIMVVCVFQICHELLCIRHQQSCAMLRSFGAESLPPFDALGNAGLVFVVDRPFACFSVGR